MVEICEHEDPLDSDIYSFSNVKKSWERWNPTEDKIEIVEIIVNVQFRICSDCNVLIFKKEEQIGEETTKIKDEKQNG